MINEEVKVIFKEGEDIRVLRGKKIDEDDIFIVIQRNDGHFWINKTEIIKIEERRVNDDPIH